MTQLASSQTSVHDTPVTSRRARYSELAARVALALVFFGAAVPKLTGDATMISMFDELGGGDPLRLFVGCAEVAGAIGLFIPRLRHLAALGLTLLMIGATVSTIAVLHDNPLVPAVLGVVAACVARIAFAARRFPRNG